MEHTRVGQKTSRISTKSVSEPYAGLTAKWGSRAVADAAKEANISTVYFADIHTFKILLGVFERQELIVNGD